MQLKLKIQSSMKGPLQLLILVSDISFVSVSLCPHLSNLCGTNSGLSVSEEQTEEQALCSLLVVQIQHIFTFEL